MSLNHANRSAAIRDWMRERAGQRFNLTQVARATGFERSAVRKTLSNLVTAGNVSGPGRGKWAREDDKTWGRNVVNKKLDARKKPRPEDRHKPLTACPDLPERTDLMALPPQRSPFVELDAAAYRRLVQPNWSSL